MEIDVSCDVEQLQFKGPFVPETTLPYISVNSLFFIRKILVGSLLEGLPRLILPRFLGLDDKGVCPYGVDPF